MKKFLSLVLVLVMTMSLVTISAGAKDFTDGSDITYGKAVDVVSELGIVDGYENGSFQPTNTLTRGAAAKIICNLILGPTTADALSADTAPYSDVPTSNTFAGYIAYCSQQGIISGYADGTFRPAATLTGYAFMKMLLGALGYDAEIENYVGGNWSVQVGKQAIGIGLNDGNANFVGTQAVTREEACLYAFNTLEATMVEYDSRTSVSIGGADVVIAGSKAKEMEQGSYKSYTGASAANDTTLEFCERYFSDLKKDAGNDDFGRPADTWKIKSTAIGTYPNTSDLVGTFTKKVTKKALYDTVGKTAFDDLKDDDATLSYYMNGLRTIVDADDVGDFMDRNSTAKINADADTGNGTLTEVYVDDDNNVTVVAIETYVFQASADYNSSNDNVRIAAAGSTSISLNSNTLDGEDFDIKDVQEDDYLLINATRSTSNGRYEVQVVTPAELVTGEVTSYSSGDDVTIGGATYEYSNTATGTVKDEISSTGGSTALVLDAYGYIIAVDDTVLGGNYVFINATDQKSGVSRDVEASAFFADGSSATIDLNRLGSTNITASNYNTADGGSPICGWYSYSVTSSGKYNLNVVSGSFNTVKNMTRTDTQILLTNGSSVLRDLESTTVRANENTVFVVVDTDGDVATYTGVSNAPDVEVTAVGGNNYSMGYVYRSRGTGANYATLVFINVEGVTATVDSSEDDTFAFLVRQKSTKNDGNDRYYVYEAIVDNAVVDIEGDFDYTSSANLMKLYSKIRTDGDTNRITGLRETDYTGGTAGNAIDKTYSGDVSLTNSVVGYSNGVLTLSNTNGSTTKSFLLNSDSQVSLILDYNRVTGNADPDVRAMMSDSGLRHEVLTGLNGSSLRSALDGYNVSGYFYAVTDDDYTTNETVKQLYIYVDSAVNTGATTAVTPTVTISGDNSYVEGDTFTALTASVSNSAACGRLSYQWYKNGTAISGATSASYTPDGAGTYKCVVTNTDTSKDTVTASGEATQAVTVTPALAPTMDVLVSYELANSTSVGAEDAPIAVEAVTGKAYASVGSQPELTIPDGYVVVRNTIVEFKAGGYAEVVVVVRASATDATATAKAALGADNAGGATVTEDLTVDNSANTMKVTVGGSVATSGDTIVVTVSATDSNASVDYPTVTLTYDGASWNADHGTVTVTAEDGTTTKAYTVSVA